MNINATISIMVDREGAIIEICDKDANVEFVSIQMSAENFMAALGRLSNCSTESCQVSGLDKLGKVHSCKRFKFEIDTHDYKTRDARAKVLCAKLCPDGWIPDLYFGSRDSFFSKDGKDYAQCVIRTYTAKKGTNENPI